MLIYYVYLKKISFPNDCVTLLYAAKFPKKDLKNNSIFETKSFLKKNSIVTYKFLGILKRESFEEIFKCLKRFGKEKNLSLEYVDENNNKKFFQTLNNFKTEINNDLKNKMSNVTSESLNPIFGKVKYKCVEKIAAPYSKKEIIEICKSFAKIIGKNFSNGFEENFRFQFYERFKGDLRYCKYLENNCSKEKIKVFENLSCPIEDYVEFLKNCRGAYVVEFLEG